MPLFQKANPLEGLAHAINSLGTVMDNNARIQMALISLLEEKSIFVKEELQTAVDKKIAEYNTFLEEQKNKTNIQIVQPGVKLD